jgi:hypothetical protein
MMMTAIACKEAGLHFAGLFLIDIDCFVLHSAHIYRQYYHVAWEGFPGGPYENFEWEHDFYNQHKLVKPV